MPNTFLELPVPAGVGAGAGVDVSAMGTQKTLIIGGDFFAGLVIEASQDGVSWSEVKSFGSPGLYALTAAAIEMRVRVVNLPTAGGSLPDSVWIGAQDRTLLSAQLDVPGVDGPGVAFDASLYGPTQTFLIAATGEWAGRVVIEASLDGTNWAPYVATQVGPDVIVQEGTVSELRVVTSGGAGAVAGISVAVVGEDPA